MSRYLASIFLIISAIFSLNAQPNLGLPFIRYYSANDYNAGIQNWHISQDSRGIIYVANNFGLLEFDGSAWRMYPVASGVKVRHFSFRPDRKINIAGQGEFGYFTSGANGQWDYTTLSGNLNEDNRDFEETWKVFHLDEKEYFCTTSKIFVFENGQVEIISSDDVMENFFLINQKLYVFKPTKGLFILEGGELTPLKNSELIGNSWVSSLIPLSNNKLMVVTKQHGIHIIDTFNNEIWQPQIREILSQSSINTAIRLNNGNYAFGTQNNGLLVFSPDGELINHLTKNFGLNNRTIICLFEDKQSNLWVGHNNGISYIELGQPFVFINEHMGLPGTGYAGFQDNGTLYLGTNNGLFKSRVESADFFNDRFEILEHTEGQVYHINKIDDQYLVGHHNGSYYFNENRATIKSSGSGTWIFQQLKSNPEYLIAGTYSGLELYKKGTNSIHFIRRLKGFDESCRILEQDQHGHIWMTHGYKGVFRFSLSEDLLSVNEIQFYGVEKGFPSNVLINVYRIRGGLYFTTVDGVYTYDAISDRFEKDSFFQKFFEPDSPLNVLAEDANQNIYFLGQNEIGVLKKDAAGDYTKETDTFNKIKEMLNDDLQNISILPNNRILYGAKDGFIIYDPNMDIPTDYDFHGLIRKVTLTGQPDSVIFFGNYADNAQMLLEQPNSAIYKLPFEKNSLKFEYSATFMDGLEKTTYQYFLDGFDNDWSDWENKNEKEYTNLYEGKYTFKVRARNLHGQISNETQYHFIILPPWYRTNLAYVSYFLVFSLAFIALLGTISKRHKKEKTRLLLTQKDELSRRDTELKSIRTTTEKEIEKLKTEKLKANIQHKNKELATATMHLINKNEFIANVKQNLTSLVKRNPKDPLIHDLQKIMASIDRNISDDDDWQQFEIHFDQVHGDFSKRLKDKFPNLSPQERRLCAYLRMNMTTKEIANLLNITVRGAEISRYRLRKKLELDRDTNLAEYILNF